MQTFQMSYTPEYSVTQRNGPFRSTYSGFTPATGEVYSSRFYWEPTMTYSTNQVDSIHADGTTATPVRLDQYDRTSPSKTIFTRSMWNGSAWVPTLISTSETDDQGVLTSYVNQSMVAGTMTVIDSTHLDVTRDLKGNVTSIKVYQWSAQDPTLRAVAEQRYTLNGDGSIATAEVWTDMGGPELQRSLRLHSFDWAIRDKSFNYVTRDQGMDLFYGGDGWRSATVDIWNGTDWSEMYQLSQTFDEQGRLTSYNFNGMTRDTFVFDQGLITTAQTDAVSGGGWVTTKGNKTLFDRDANGTLRSVTTQRFDLQQSQYVNERIYFYQSGTASVGSASNGISISLYPNPAQKELNVHSVEPIESVQITSMTGQALLTETGSIVDVSTLPPGVYSVRVVTKAGDTPLKFVKSH